jgi:hypothetical protein
MILPTMYDAVKHISSSLRQHRQKKLSRQKRYHLKGTASGMLNQIQFTSKDCFMNYTSKDSSSDVSKLSFETRDDSNTVKINGSEIRMNFSEMEPTQGKEHSIELQNNNHFQHSNHHSPMSISSEYSSNKKHDDKFLFPNSDECHHSSTSRSIYQYSVGTSADPRSEGHGVWKIKVSRQSSRSENEPCKTKPLWKLTDFTAVPQKPSLLGNGKFGKVKLCRTVISQTLKQGSNENDIDSQEIKVAVKILKKSSKQNKLLWRREVEIQTRLSHPNILHCYGYFQCSSHLYIVLDYCPDRDLATYSNQHTLSMQACRNVILQVTSALNYLQQRSVAHRDVKSENILIDASGDIKLADFGYAVYCPSSDLRMTFCGTLPCLPPELLLCSTAPYHALCVDAWSLGILVYELILKRPLWIDCDPQKVKDQILRFSDARLRKLMREMIILEDATFPSWSNFVTSLLRRNPKSRMTIDQAMRHDWLLKPEGSETKKRKNR